jgi:hypothetical protein
MTEGCAVASVLGMLEEREAAARVRVEGLREEAAREELVEALAMSAAETTAVTETEQETVPSPVPGAVVPP